jgi:hypothetical protein
MGRRVAAVGVVLAGFAACTTFSGGGGDGTRADAGDAPSAADGDAGGGDDAPPDALRVVDSGDLFDQRFDTSCDGWVFAGGVSFVWTPNAGRDGGGACLATVPTDANLWRDLPGDQAGYYEVDVWLRAVSDAGTPLVQLQLLFPDGGPAPFGGNPAPPSSDYVLVQASATTSDPPSNAQIHLTGLGPAQYYVDSVRLFHHQP